MSAVLKLKRSKQHPSTYPVWFKPVMAVNEDLGGGWYGYVAISVLLRMLPPWNPDGRTNPEDRRSGLKSLTRSIESQGLCQFPVVNRRHVVDGNRRIYAAALAGVEEMLVLFRPKANATTFAEIQSESRQHTPAQKMQSYLRNPSSTTAVFQRLAAHTVDLLGRQLVEQCVNVGRNPIDMLRWSKRAWDYCQPVQNYKHFLKCAVRLQLKFSQTRALRHWLEAENSPFVLCNHVLDIEKLPECCE